MSDTPLTLRLADCVSDPGHDDLPDAVTRAVRRAILDSVGVTVAGACHPAARIIAGMVENLHGAGRCRIVGSEGQTDLINAALANGVAAHVLDWDDTILPTRAHLSAALLPALVAVGETEGWTLGQIVPAFALGFELQSRLNHAIYPSVHLRGWQGTGIVGGIGTAAAVGRMLRLAPAEIAHAMGIAATNASGLIATFGSMSKPLNIARAGASGLQSALLAQRGYTSHPDILGTGRFLEKFDEAPRLGLLTDELGEKWSVLQNGYKPYPCGFVAHAMIDAVRELRDNLGPDAKLHRLRLHVSPESTQLMGNIDPSNELEAKFSLLYDAAVAWQDGNVTPAAFEPEAIQNPSYRRIMALTEIVTDTSVRQHEATAHADLEDGSSLTVQVQHARGTPDRPLTDSDLIDKFASALEQGGVTGAQDLAKTILEGDIALEALMDSLQGHASTAATWRPPELV